METDRNIVTAKNLEFIESQFKEFIIKKKHPCIMAKTVFTMEKYQIKLYSGMQDKNATRELIDDIENYIRTYDFETNQFETFIAVFPNEHINDELEFENNLWDLLNALHAHDDCQWDSSVSNDPKNSKFSFSIKGRAFYIVGLHPKSSRKSRRSPYTAVVFNLHSQFELLREMGSYKKIKKRIRKRDKLLQGYINPVLKDFGQDSEAKQYSGRNVGDGWKCPFDPANTIKV
jgi:hypothetical protein